jgi:hypothetical protein
MLINNMQFDSVLLQYVIEPVNDLVEPPNIGVVLVTIALAKHVWVSDEHLVNAHLPQCLRQEPNGCTIVMP